MLSQERRWYIAPSMKARYWYGFLMRMSKRQVLKIPFALIQVMRASFSASLFLFALPAFIIFPCTYGNGFSDLDQCLLFSFRRADGLIKAIPYTSSRRATQELAISSWCERSLHYVKRFVLCSSSKNSSQEASVIKHPHTCWKTNQTQNHLPGHQAQRHLWLISGTTRTAVVRKQEI